MSFRNHVFQIRLFQTKFSQILLLATLVTALTFPLTAFADPNPSNNPALNNLMKGGAKLYYLGNRNGLDGWFIVKDGQVQMIYSSPDGQAALAGVLFGSDGENVTALQVQTLLTNNKDLMASLQAANSPLAAGMPGAPPAAVAAAAASGATAPAATMAGITPLHASVPDFTPPGERLYKDLSAASGVVVGSTTAPLILMVMDPNCPHCQATWRALRDSVMKNTLQIKLIPIGTPGTDNERAAAKLLHVAEPLSAWDKYVDGDKTQLAGTPDPALIASVHTNHELVDSWNIRDTPFLVYRAKDGLIKIVRGEPDNKGANLLSDLIP